MKNSTPDIETRLQAVLRKVLNDRDLVLAECLSSTEFPRLDSLAEMHLLLESEREFGIRFSAAEALEVRNVADLLKMIRVKVRPT
jgi:acyl carrier protein